MAKIDVIMPQMGESIAEGTLSRWMKKVGDTVKRDEPIFEISTDKVDAEIPAPIAGVLTEIIVTEGQTVAVQTIVARIDTEVGAAVAAPAPVAPAPAAAAVPAAVTQVAPPVARVAAPAAPTNGGAESAEERLRRKSTPLVRRIAQEHNLDIANVPGTGMAGRVTKNDVIAFLEAAPLAPAPVAAVAAVASVPVMPVVPAAPAPVAAPVVPAHAPVVDAWEGDRVEPWSRIRKLTADHMVQSRRMSAHVQTFFEIDYTRIVGLRAKHKAAFAERGVNLTYLAFIVKAIADNLRKHPGINAAVSGESTILRRDINLGIAVALDWGLIVPVIRRADELSLLGVARAIADLAERARIKKLSPDEVQRGTFTVTNPGTFGSVIGTPIINQPQTAILAVGTIEKQPAVVSVNGTDAIAIRTKGMLALSFDHRVIDGADADRFMADVKQTLQQFPDDAA
jgi:2-oxoglutarate dehydrogenase E2 component (dihydrolipoamide succinyltransferase)